MENTTLTLKHLTHIIPHICIRTIVHKLADHICMTFLTSE